MNRLAAAAGMLLCCLAAAQENSFAVQKVWFEEKNGGYAVRADLQVGEQAWLDKILRGGYSAEFNFELNFVRRREWLLDRVVGDLSWRGALSYDSLTQRYILNDSGDRRHRFSTLADALKKISRLRAGSNTDEEYISILLRDDVYLRARFYLATDTLPEPLQVELFVDDSLLADSDWVSLPLETTKQ